jgi:hypothetical protein
MEVGGRAEVRWRWHACQVTGDDARFATHPPELLSGRHKGDRRLW